MSYIAEDITENPANWDHYEIVLEYLACTLRRLPGDKFAILNSPSVCSITDLEIMNSIRTSPNRVNRRKAQGVGTESVMSRTEIIWALEDLVACGSVIDLGDGMYKEAGMTVDEAKYNDYCIACNRRIDSPGDSLKVRQLAGHRRIHKGCRDVHLENQRDWSL